MIRLLLVVSLMSGSAAFAQEIPAAKGPGSYLAVGGTVSGFESDYGQRELGGATLFVDANVYERFGIEAEVRKLQLHSDDGTRMTTYLLGPRLSREFHSLRVYTKLIAGRGTFEFPYSYARGSYFVIAAGMGIDWRVRRTPLIVRLVDLEYQRWPQFTFGDLCPYGLSTGLSFRIF